MESIGQRKCRQSHLVLAVFFMLLMVIFCTLKLTFHITSPIAFALNPPFQGSMVVPAVDCTDSSNLRSRSNANAYNTLAKVGTTGVPSFQMSIHNPTEDRFISADIVSKGCWECHALSHTLYALQSRSDAILLDIGSNIGLYSLAAASLGHKAFAFEPSHENWRRICLSVNANRDFSKYVTLYDVALAESEMIVKLDYNKGSRNIGSIRTQKMDGSLRESANKENALMKGTDYARGVPLDFMQSQLPVNVPVVVKVDVEGAECKALSGALGYLNKVDIMYVAIEWEISRLRNCIDRESIFALFAKNKLKPYKWSFETNQWDLLDPKNWENWPKTLWDMVRSHHKRFGISSDICLMLTLLYAFFFVLLSCSLGPEKFLCLWKDRPARLRIGGQSQPPQKRLSYQKQ